MSLDPIVVIVVAAAADVSVEVLFKKSSLASSVVPFEYVELIVLKLPLVVR